MQVILVLSAIMAIGSAMTFPGARKECIAELGIDEPKFGWGKPPPDFKDMDPNLQCLSKCTVEKMGVISADGAFNDEKIPDDLKASAKKCFEDNKDLEACERAHNYLVCNFKGIFAGIKALSEACAKETNTTPTRGRLDEVMKDENMACYSRCMMIKMKKMDENDEFIVETLISHAPDGVNVADIAQTCAKDNNQEDKCVKAAQRGLCLITEMKKNRQ